MQDGFIKFHGCGVYRRDGSNVLSTKRRPFKNPVNACFWMLGEDVTKKVRTRNREFNEKVYHSQSFKNQYQIELIKRKQYQYYSTDDETESNDETDDSDDNKLVIDIENVKKTISNRITPLLIKVTENQLKQLPIIKNTDQDPSSQIPDNK